MHVRRIVTNIAADPLDAVATFYGDVFGLGMLMDHGWIQTLGADTTMPVQLSIASEGGSNTPVPDLSMEVDDLDEALSRAQQAGAPIEYGPADEPWGVRRFYVRDPAGKLINVMHHTE